MSSFISLTRLKRSRKTKKIFQENKSQRKKFYELIFVVVVVGRIGKEKEMIGRSLFIGLGCSLMVERIKSEIEIELSRSDRLVLLFLELKTLLIQKSNPPWYFYFDR